MKNCLSIKILGLLVVTLLLASCSGDSDIAGGNTNTGGECDSSISSIITNGSVPSDLSNYNQISREIFSRYEAGATVVARYVKQGGTGDGSTSATAASNVKTVLDGITDASASKVYAVLIAPGTYDAGEAMAMKNNVAIVGGVSQCLGVSSSSGDTVLSGGNAHRVFYHPEGKGLDHTAVLYGVTIANGKTTWDAGGGMYNLYSSPVLIRVIFSKNIAIWGGGMYNNLSSPVLTGVTFSGNTATGTRGQGGGMYNTESFPVLIGVTFSGNKATGDGGGMANTLNSYPVMVGVTFSGNTATGSGGGMYNHRSSPVLVNTILWGNTAGNGNEISGDGSALVTSIVSNVTNSTDPGLLSLADNGGGILTHAIPASSSAVNQGIYVKRSAKPTGRRCGDSCDTYTFYYSTDNSIWYSDLGLTTPFALVGDEIDLTATDATGYTRRGRPDIGAYEAR